MYAAGKIPGGFIKREGRPTEQAILTCRSPTARSGRCSRRTTATTSRS